MERFFYDFGGHNNVKRRGLQVKKRFRVQGSGFRVSKIQKFAENCTRIAQTLKSQELQQDELKCISNIQPHAPCSVPHALKRHPLCFNPEPSSLNIFDDQLGRLRSPPAIPANFVGDFIEAIFLRPLAIHVEMNRVDFFRI